MEMPDKDLAAYRHSDYRERSRGEEESNESMTATNGNTLGGPALHSSFPLVR